MPNMSAPRAVSDKRFDPVLDANAKRFVVPEPVRARVALGEVVPIPRVPPIYEFSVVVLFPKIVSPVAPVPPPIVDDANTPIPMVPTVVDGERRKPSYTQLLPPLAVALSTPFVTERFVPVISVITSLPILNDVAARLVVVAFVIVAFVPRNAESVAFVPKRLVKVPVVLKKFVDDAAVVVPEFAVKVLRYALPETVSAVLDAKPRVEELVTFTLANCAFPVANTLPNIPALPATVRSSDGDVVPMPIFPS